MSNPCTCSVQQGVVGVALQHHGSRRGVFYNVVTHRDTRQKAWQITLSMV